MSSVVRVYFVVRALLSRRRPFLTAFRQQADMRPKGSQLRKSMYCAQGPIWTVDQEPSGIDQL
eukprot:3411543-Amphidinium_carterae.1